MDLSEKVPLLLKQRYVLDMRYYTTKAKYLHEYNRRLLYDYAIRKKKKKVDVTANRTAKLQVVKKNRAGVPRFLFCCAHDANPVCPKATREH